MLDFLDFLNLDFLEHFLDFLEIKGGAGHKSFTYWDIMIPPDDYFLLVVN